MARITEELYKNGLNDTDKQNGVVTHLKPDILESKVKWALGSITTTHKVSRTDRISGELFKIFKKNDTVNMPSPHASKFGKLSSGHRIGKGQFSFQSQRRAMPKNIQTTLQLCSFHMLVRLCSKFSKLGFSNM